MTGTGAGKSWRSVKVQRLGQEGFRRGRTKQQGSQDLKVTLSTRNYSDLGKGYVGPCVRGTWNVGSETGCQCLFCPVSHNQAGSRDFLQGYTSVHKTNAHCCAELLLQTTGARQHPCCTPHHSRSETHGEQALLSLALCGSARLQHG